MANKKHPLIDDPRLTAWILGELDESEASEIQSAVDSSSELQSEIAQLRRVCNLLSDEMSNTSEDPPRLTADQHDQIAGAIAAAAPSSADSERVSDEIAIPSEKSSLKTASQKPSSNWRRFLIAASVLLLLGTSATLFLKFDPFGWTPLASFQVANNDRVEKNLDVDLRGENGIDRSSSGEMDQREGEILDNFGQPATLSDPNIDSRPKDGNASGGGDIPIGGHSLDVDRNGRDILGEKFLEEDGSEGKQREGPGGGVFFNTIGGVFGPKPGRVATGKISGDDERNKLPLLFPNPEQWDSKIQLRTKYSGIRLLNSNELEWTIQSLSQGKSKSELRTILKNVRQNEGDDDESIESRLAEFDKVVKRFESSKDARPKSWKRIKAIPNTSRLMIGDKEELGISGMQVNVQIDGFRARVVIDYFFYNDRDRQLEGSFKLRLPNEASPYYFAFGESRFDFSPDSKDLDTRLRREFVRPGDDTRFVSLSPSNIRDMRKGAWDKVKEARMVPRQKAAFAYQQTTKRQIDPALVEWAGAGVFNAKVFPLAPKKLHRIVVGYDVNLTQADDRWVYQLALPEQAGDCMVDVRVASTDDVVVSPSVELDKFEGTANFHLDNPTKKSFALSVPAEPGIVLTREVDDDVSFFATRVSLPLESKSQDASSHAIFLVDTSLSSRPEKFNLWLKMLTRLLAENRDSMKRFNVVFFNVESYLWKPTFVDNTEKNVDTLIAECNSIVLEGATDLYSAVRMATTTSWSGPDSNACPDLFLLSDGAATWGETNLQLIARQLETKSVGSLFAYQAGMSGTSIRALHFLTSKTGGAVFSVVGEAETKTAARAHRNQPWRLVDITGDGATDIMTAGRVQWVYPGQTMMVVGRGAPQKELVFTLANGEQQKTFQVPMNRRHETELAVRAYGQISVGQLENLGDTVNDFSTAYARHFRVTGQTCSLLMLDSEADYQRFNIKPENDLFVVTSKPCRRIVETELTKNAAAIANPKTMLNLWLEQLESAPQINFKVPTALRLALEQVRVPVIAGKLNCKWRNETQYSASFLKILENEKLDYDKLITEARRRRAEASGDDAIKALSSLIEQNPGNLQLIRDVAFMAMEFDRPEQAYPLLKTVALARPYNAVVYTALARCLTEMGNVDLAMVFYEIAVTGTFNKSDFRQIASTEYIGLLKQIERGEHQTRLKSYAKSRLTTLVKTAAVSQSDVVVTMMWNTDRSDVDLHVIDSAGEECSYEHKQTKMGGKITEDITDGYGPEMFWLPKAKSGRYQVKVNYFGSDNLRSGMRSKVHVTVYQNFGTVNQTMTRKTVSLGRTKEMRTVVEFKVKK